MPRVLRNSGALLTLLTAACTSTASSHSGDRCPPSAKCPPPPLPQVSATLTIDGHPYSGRLTALPAERVRFEFPSGKRVAVTLKMRAPANTRLANVWLTVNSYPSGNDGGRPSGKYKLLLRHPGPMSEGQQLATTWTATPLFSTTSLDLTVTYSVRNATGSASVSAPIAHLHVAR